MRCESNQNSESAERLVVIGLLGRARGHRRVTLYRNLRDHDRAEIDAAISQLVEVGVLATSGDRVAATRTVNRLEALGLVGI
jgi:hypothetical protein